MNFFAKGDFKTRQQWLKRQRKDLMKKQSQKYHEFNNKAVQPKSTLKSPFPQQKCTLSHILKTDDTERISNSNSISEVGEKLAKEIKNEKDRELYESMRARVEQMEEVAANQRTEIRMMEREIQELTCQNSVLEAGMEGETQSLFHKKQQLTTENHLLHDRFTEMQNYLNQHGAYWSQNKLQGELNILKIKQDINLTKPEYRMPAQFQFQTLLKRIEELNEGLLGQFGSQKFRRVGGVHRLLELEEIRVTFYGDGLEMETAGVFAYRSKEGLRILGDLLDGYYPHVLKTKYPEGVLMKTINSLSLPSPAPTPSQQSTPLPSSPSPYFLGPAVSLQ